MSGPRKPATKKPPQKPPTKRGLPAHLVPGNPGNSGGKPGRSGRPTNAFKAECDRLTDEVVLPKLAKKLAETDVDDSTWRWCAEFVASHSKSKAPTKQETDVTVRAGVVVLPAPEAPIAIVEPHG